MMKFRKNGERFMFNIIRFYLALIRPALELFEGKILTDEAGDKLYVKIE